MAHQGLIENADSLRVLLRQDDNLCDLEACLDVIERAVTTIWTDNHQPWFTDHGPAHSRRTAEYALKLTALPKLHPDYWLSPLEAFILWAAAWLHDVGMQDMLAAGAPLGEIDSAGFAAVRHQHPERSSERILAEYGALGLPAQDAALAETVAAVARAHGTRFYRNTVRTALAPATTVRNRPVRARLLAALLLFADELDLHYERSRKPSGWAIDNGVSQAHKFKHDSVRFVSPVCTEDGRIAVELQLAFSADLASADADAVRRWIEVKLRQQMSLVEPELEEGFGRQVAFDRVIKTVVVPQRAHKELPSSSALAFIRAETARDELINHDLDFDKVLREIGAGAIVLVTDGGPSEDPADNGSGDLVVAACAKAEASGHRVCLTRRPRFSLVATASDVVGALAAALGAAEPPTTVDEGSRRSAALASLLTAVRVDAQTPHLFAVDRAQAIDRESLHWLAHTAIPALRAATTAAFLFTADETAHFAVPGETVTAISMGETDRDAFAAYLGRFTSRRTAQAESQALPGYRVVKRTAQYHEIELRAGG